MAEALIGKTADFGEGDRRIVFVGDHEIGVFRDGGELHAYGNFCLHQGGPACEERIMPPRNEKQRQNLKRFGNLAGPDPGRGIDLDQIAGCGPI